MYALEGRSPEGLPYLAAPVELPHPGTITIAPVEAHPLPLLIRTSLGHGVGGASVSAKLVGGSPARDPLGPPQLLSTAFTTSGADGVATLDPLPAGPYELEVSVGEERYQFRVDHDGRHARRHRLTVPADPRVRVRIVDRDGKPLPRTSLLVGASGRAGRMTTDDEGVLVVARGHPPTLALSATDEHNGLSGKVTIHHSKILEGQVSSTLRLEPVPMQPFERVGAGAMRRRAIVRTPSGQPVRGARVYGWRDSALTGSNGVAKLGEMPEDGAIRLERTDLASGFPSSGVVGDRELLQFTWNAGREVKITVTDARFGFRIGGKVRIGLQPGAWRRVEPGTFVSRWDPATAPDDALITVVAPGYERFEIVPPYGAGPPMEFEAKLVRKGVGDTATLVLRITKNGLPTVGVLIGAASMETWVDVPGRATVHAMSGDDGRVVLRDLRTGRWRFEAYAEWKGWGANNFVLTKGPQEMQLELTRPPSLVGQVIDDRGHPVANALVSSPHARGGVARTKRNGRFALSAKKWRAAAVEIVASKPGYATGRATWKRTKGRWKKAPVVLHRHRTLSLPLAWEDRGGDPPPADLEVLVIGPDGKGRRIARVEDGRLVADSVPPGVLRLKQLRGSAYLPSWSIADKKKDLITLPVVKLKRGTRLLGRVQRRKSGVEGVLVSVQTATGRPRIAISDKHGNFEIRGLPPGPVSIEAEGQLPESRERNRGLTARDLETLKVVIDR
jgi:hypothetical protein